MQISLIPSVDGMKIFEGSGVAERMREEFVSYGCRENQMGVTRPDDPELCRRYIFSISAIMHNQAVGMLYAGTTQRPYIHN